MKFPETRNSLTLKILFTGFLCVVLLIPLGMVNSLISEREARRNSAVTEVSEKWGLPQDIRGPVLVVPYRVTYRDDDNILRTKVQHAFFLPETLGIKGRVIPERRSRGLYEVVLYSLKGLRFVGSFARPETGRLEIAGDALMWNQAFLAVGIPDGRGIQRAVRLNWNGRESQFLPGAKGVLPSGIHAPVSLQADSAGKYNFDFTIDLLGSSSLSFLPLGKDTVVELDSPWPHPSFYGAYLPSARRVDAKGFSAVWRVSYFGRNIPQEWTDTEAPGPADLAKSAFGVKMYQPVDFYQQCVRAAKYGFLFISLTFLAFFLFELFMKLNIHPIQYLMVGFAMCLFYLLFLSLSEQAGFLFSYLFSSLATIGLITAYCVKVLKTRGRAGIMLGILAGLYSYLFILLENEDYTLLLGSVALFAVLAAVMYITRDIDWYRIRIGAREEKGTL